MISRELFEDQIDLANDLDKMTDSLYDLGIDIANSKLFSIPAALVLNFWKSHFTEEGVDLIEWWLYEDVEKTVEADGTKIDLTSIDALYDFLAENHYDLH